MLTFNKDIGVICEQGKFAPILLSSASRTPLRAAKYLYRPAANQGDPTHEKNSSTLPVRRAAAWLHERMHRCR